MKAKNLIPKVARETFKSVIYKHPGCLWYLQNPYNDSPQLRMNYLYSKYSVHMPFLSVTPPPPPNPFLFPRSTVTYGWPQWGRAAAIPNHYILFIIVSSCFYTLAQEQDLISLQWKKKSMTAEQKQGSHTLQVINITSLFIERGLIPS